MRVFSPTTIVPTSGSRFDRTKATGPGPPVGPPAGFVGGPTDGGSTIGAPSAGPADGAPMVLPPAPEWESIASAASETSATPEDTGDSPAPTLGEGDECSCAHSSASLSTRTPPASLCVTPPGGQITPPERESHRPGWESCCGGSRQTTSPAGSLAGSVVGAAPAMFGVVGAGAPAAMGGPSRTAHPLEKTAVEPFLSDRPTGRLPQRSLRAEAEVFVPGATAPAPVVVPHTTEGSCCGQGGGAGGAPGGAAAEGASAGRAGGAFYGGAIHPPVLMGGGSTSARGQFLPPAFSSIAAAPMDHAADPFSAAWFHPHAHAPWTERGSGIPPHLRGRVPPGGAGIHPHAQWTSFDLLPAPEQFISPQFTLDVKIAGARETLASASSATEVGKLFRAAQEEEQDEDCGGPRRAPFANLRRGSGVVPHHLLPKIEQGERDFFLKTILDALHPNVRALMVVVKTWMKNRTAVFREARKGGLNSISINLLVLVYVWELVMGTAGGGGGDDHGVRRTTSSDDVIVEGGEEDNTDQRRDDHDGRVKVDGRSTDDGFTKDCLFSSSSFVHKNGGAAPFAGAALPRTKEQKAAPPCTLSSLLLLEEPHCYRSDICPPTSSPPPVRAEAVLDLFFGFLGFLVRLFASSVEESTTSSASSGVGVQWRVQKFEFVAGPDCSRLPFRVLRSALDPAFVRAVNGGVPRSPNESFLSPLLLVDPDV